MSGNGDGRTPLIATSIDSAIVDRRSVRRFRDEPVPLGLVEEILQLAIWAPSPHNAQPCRYTVLTRPEDKAALAHAMAGRLEDELESEGLARALIDDQMSRSKLRIEGAPVVLLCSLSADGLIAHADSRKANLEWQMAVQSLGAALQTIFLAAWTRGLGTCWMAAPMYCPDVVRRALDLSETVVPQALVLLGYPESPGKLRPRRPIHEMIEVR